MPSVGRVYLLAIKQSASLSTPAGPLPTLLCSARRRRADSKSCLHARRCTCGSPSRCVTDLLPSRPSALAILVLLTTVPVSPRRRALQWLAGPARRPWTTHPRSQSIGSHGVQNRSRGAVGRSRRRSKLGCARRPSLTSPFDVLAALRHVVRVRIAPVRLFSRRRDEFAAG
ncbi:hypothetical protein BJ912DRAFT_950688 [Pholiota molesta]|nr:hypothetical protein BJ912DRAFT_950688 [Pholiota molesta]